MSRTTRNNNLIAIMGFGFVNFEFHLMEEYINHMESHFDNEYKKIESEYDAFVISKQKENNFSEEYLNHLEDSFIDQSFMLNDIYIKNYRQGQIIQLYSMLEDVLKKGCDRYASFTNTEYKVSDLNGNNDIDKIKKFLKNSVKIDFSKLNPEWSFIDNLRQVRNLVVHHKSIIKNNDTQNNKDKRFNNLKKFGKNRYTLKSRDMNGNKFEIVFDNPNFLKEIIDNIENLIIKIGTQPVP